MKKTDKLFLAMIWVTKGTIWQNVWAEDEDEAKIKVISYISKKNKDGNIKKVRIIETII